MGGRIVFQTCDAPDFTAGPNSWLRRLLPALRERGWEPTVLAWAYGDVSRLPLLSELQRERIPFHTFDFQATTDRKIPWILERCREAGAQVFVPNIIPTAYLAARWLRAAGVPTVGTLHSDDRFYRYVAERFVAGPARWRVSAVACVSRFLFDALRDAAPPTPLFHVPYGVPIPPASPEPPAKELRLVYFGRLVQEQKRILDVTGALCRAATEVPGVRATLFGTGEAEPQVRALLEARGGGRVDFGGAVRNSEMASRLAGFHATLLLSDYEGLPLSLLEAMAVGVIPIVLQTRSGVPELVEDGVTGLVVRDRDGGVLEAVRRLRDDEALRRRLRDGARARVAERYGPAREVDAWATLLASLPVPKAPPAIRAPRLLRLPPPDAACVPEDSRRPSFGERVRRWTRRRLARA